MLGVRVPESAVLETACLEPQSFLFSVTGIDLPLFPRCKFVKGLRAVWDELVRFFEFRRRVAAHPHQDPSLVQKRVENLLVPPAQVDAPLELGQSELVVSHLVVSTRQIKRDARIVGPLELFSFQDPDVEVTPALFGFRVEDFPVHEAHPEILAGHHNVFASVIVTERRKLVDWVRVVPALALAQGVLRRGEHHLHLELHVCRLSNHAHALAADMCTPEAALLLEAPGDHPEAPHVFKSEVGVGHESVRGVSSMCPESVVPGRRKVHKGLFHELTWCRSEIAANHALCAICRSGIHDRPVVDVRCRRAHSLSDRGCFVLDDHREAQRGAVCVVRLNR